MITSASMTHAAVLTGSCRALPASSVDSSPESIMNLPMKPDSGGVPVSSSVQARNEKPRKAVDAGMTRPVSASCCSSRLVSRGGSISSRKNGTGSASSGLGNSLSSSRLRSISSMSRNIAPAAMVELSR